MFEIDPMSRIPIYKQLIDRIETLILRGVLRPGDKLPSTRQMSCQLSVNPNTIQKAYSELLLRNVISTAPGRGCFVSEQAVEILGETRRAGLTELEKQVTELAQAGVSRKELISLIEQVYEKENRQ